MMTEPLPPLPPGADALIRSLREYRWRLGTTNLYGPQTLHSVDQRSDAILSTQRPAGVEVYLADDLDRALAAVLDRPAQPPEDQVTECCHITVPFDARFCPKCGWEFRAASRPAPEPDK